ncbi:hypothetical protein ENBRE01_2518 [Enteropsectra breve]|nr:hypothetical protein ENBRE01_2518 [Enteropsectra breve]
MFAHLLAVAARSTVFTARSESDLNGRSSHVRTTLAGRDIKYDPSIKEKTFGLEIDSLKLEIEDTEEIEGIIAMADRMDAIPEDMPEIITTLGASSPTLSEQLRSGAFNILIFFTKDPNQIKGIKDISNPAFKYFVCSDDAEAQKYGATFPSIYAYSVNDRNAFVMPFLGTPKSIEAAVLLKSFFKISTDSYSMLQELQQPLFYVVDKLENYSRVEETLLPEMRLLSGVGKFIFFSPEEVPALISMIKPSEQDFPFIGYIGQNVKGYLCKIEKGQLGKAVVDLLEGRAAPIVFESLIPEDNDSRNVKVVNFKSYKTILEDTETDRIIAFTSRSCGYCVTMKPHLEKFGELMKQNNVPLFVGNYSIEENDKIKNLNIEGVPSLFFIKKGSSVPERMDAGIRTLSTLLGFAAEKGDSSKIDLSKFKAAIEEFEKNNVSEEESEEEEEDLHITNERAAKDTL